MKKLTVVFLLMIMILPAAYSLTAAIGNARAIINIEASPEEPAIVDRTLKVINKNDVDVIIHLNPSEELRPYITLLDNDFLLSPGEEKNAEFVLTVDHGGTIDGVINVLFSSTDAESKESDVGLSSRLIIVSKGPLLEKPETEEVEEEIAETQEEVEGETEETVDTETAPEEEAEEETESTNDNKPIINNKPKSSNDGANPLVGVGIMAIVLAIGLAGFFVVMKVMKK